MKRYSCTRNRVAFFLVTSDSFTCRKMEDGEVVAHFWENIGKIVGLYKKFTALLVDIESIRLLSGARLDQRVSSQARVTPTLMSRRDY